MQAIRVHPSPPSTKPYSPTNPAPSAALHKDQIPIPAPTEPNQLLIHIKATTIIRDLLTWPETYQQPYRIPGHNFSGTVEAISPGTSTIFKPGDAVFGMAHADRGSTWTEYALAMTNETAYEALFVHAGLALLPLPRGAEVKPESENHEKGQDTEQLKKYVLVTGAAGGVGICLVQLASWAGVHVVAAGGSIQRNGEFLKALGADEVVAYVDLERVGEDRFDVVIDCVGRDLLASCWGLVKPRGVLISVDSASFDFVARHEKCGLRKDGVKALFFVVQGSVEALRVLGDLAARGYLRPFVAAKFEIDQVREAYDYANGRFDGRGKVVLTI